MKKVVSILLCACASIAVLSSCDRNPNDPRPPATPAPTSTPIGVVVPFAGEYDKVPPGWLLCDGSVQDSAALPDLFRVIGFTYGDGDKASDKDFNLPDLRGQFVRGVDNPTGASPGQRDPNVDARTRPFPPHDKYQGVGSVQATATKLPATPFTAGGGDHSHSFEDANQAGGGRIRITTSANDSGDQVAGNIGPSGGHSHTIDGGGDSESRPVNIALNYIIRAK